VLEKTKLLVVKECHGSHNLYWLKPVHCWTRAMPRVKLKIAWNNIRYWGWDFGGLWPGGFWILLVSHVLTFLVCLFFFLNNNSIIKGSKILNPTLNGHQHFHTCKCCPNFIRQVRKNMFSLCRD
jgi:hypothetical protein